VEMVVERDMDVLKGIDSVLVVGLGISGLAAANRLLREGKRVTVNDASRAQAIRSTAEELSMRGAEVAIGHHDTGLLAGIDLVVVSPGVPSRLPLLREAAAGGIPVWSEIELAWRFARGPVVAVTGTNGKTTTVSMIDGIFEKAGRRAVAAGNIGHPFITAVEEAAEGEILVVEVSSFQLTYIEEFKPAVSVLLNIAEDHFDWHEDMEEYVAAKSRMWMNQGQGDLVVCNLDDPMCVRAAAGATSPVAYFSRSPDARAAVYMSGGTMMSRLGDRKTLRDEQVEIMRANDLALQGEHNLENAMAAAAAAIFMGIEPEVAGEALASFKGLAHRLQFVAEIEDVSFYNDSKATNPHAVLRALGSFDAPLVVIMGGRNKGLNFDELAAELIERGSRGGVRALYLIGEAAAEMQTALGAQAAGIGIEVLPGLEEVFADLPRVVKAGDVVLFSPACGSFDRYKDYKHRGRHFQEMVKDYGNRRATGG
jgi:UDP-N-acetylmuramoylalanine--D-glutamate ligase